MARDPRPPFEIDLEATVDSIARSGGLLQAPLALSGQRRWLRAVMINESGPQMPIWSSTLSELSGLLARRGAFRSIWRQEMTIDAEDIAQLRHLASARKQRAAQMHWHRDELIIVASDFVSAPWWNGIYPACLKAWHETNHVLLLHLLPRRLWERTWTGMPDLEVSGQVPGGASASLIASAPSRLSRLVGRRSTSPTMATAIAALSDQDLGPWARVLVADSGRSDALHLGRRLRMLPAASGIASPLRNPQAQVEGFRARASPIAQRLARYLAVTAPLTLPMMRWVQTALFSEADSGHLAEFFLGGLLESVATTSEDEEVIYDLHPEVRLRLAQGMPMAEALRVIQLVGERLAKSHGFDGDPLLMVSAEPYQALPESASDLRMFAQVSRDFLTRAGRGTQALEMAPSRAGIGDIIGETTQSAAPNESPQDSPGHRSSDAQQPKKVPPSADEPRETSVAAVRKRLSLHFQDFELQILREGDLYVAHVTDSLAGRSEREVLRWPIGDAAERLLVLENAVSESQQRTPSSNLFLSPSEKILQEFGADVFRTVFVEPGNVAACYRASLDLLGMHGAGFRLSLHIEPPEMAMLPWEYLFDATSRQGGYLCLKSTFSLVRSVARHARRRAVRADGPLRVLAMIANPGGGWPGLDAEKERRRLAEILGDSVTWVPRATPDGLYEAMQHGPWHIFHFIGHGGTNRSLDADGTVNSEGFLVMDDGLGHPVNVSANQLGEILEDGGITLAVLNCSESARRNSPSSVGAALAGTAVPMAIAMQFPMTNASASRFSDQFYRSLRDGRTVETALTNARKNIRIGSNADWASPVLFTSVRPDALIFANADSAEARRKEIDGPLSPRSRAMEEMRKLWDT